MSNLSIASYQIGDDLFAIPKDGYNITPFKVSQMSIVVKPNPSQEELANYYLYEITYYTAGGLVSKDVHIFPTFEDAADGLRARLDERIKDLHDTISP